jgi:asparagine N-glycosylation enzyme membrane subunit Stt3
VSTASTERRRWLDRKENVDKVYWGVWLLCALLLAAEPFVHKHGDFAFESWFGFHGWYGFVACVGLVLAAKLLRVVLKRPEDYYERD